MKKIYRVDGLRDRLEDAIFSSGMDINEISRKSGVSRALLWAYRFDGKQPSCYSLMRLAKTLNVSTDWLLGIKTLNKERIDDI